MAYRIDKQTRQRGFTMIEVLVTMLVLALGLLGNAGMITNSLRESHSAYMRSEATILANDIIECMRANRAAAMLGDYNTALGGVPGDATVAGSDLLYWKNALANALPSGDGMVAVDMLGTVTVTVQWDDNRDGVPVVFTTQSLI